MNTYRGVRRQSWKNINEEALKCWNLERIIDAKLFGKDEPPGLSIEELLRENEGAVVSNRDDEVIILEDWAARGLLLGVWCYD